MFLDLLRKRRSIRQFEARPLSEGQINQMIEAVLRSPSSRGLQPWHFVVVRDPSVVEALAKAKPHGSTFVKNAPLVVVVCADPSISDMWVEDCSIASLQLHLVTTDMGLGSCWVQIRKRDHDEDLSAEEYVARLVGLPDGFRVEAMVAIGYPAKIPPGRARETLLYERLHYEKFVQEKTE
ncbi:MAG: NAD(P)H-dependent dehydrogenase/reductase [Deltaproteobacteria bacterium]|nr:MAG: NAD(P)H-dependent dehydrogenase/reductase [Deltaproteobacteria bacterium]